MKKRFVPLATIFFAVVFCFYTYIVKDEQTTGLIACDPPPGISEVIPEGLKPGRYIEALVTGVADGDTFDIAYKSKEYKVRLLDVDTPESVKPGVQVQPYGKEASDFTQKQVLKQRVKLVFEKDLRDRYGRLLAHVFLEDGSYLNAILVRNGYARIEFVKPNTAYKEYFESLQEQAIRDKAGLWGLAEKQRPFVKNAKGEYVPSYWK